MGALTSKTVTTKLTTDLLERLERLLEHESARVVHTKQFFRFALDHLELELEHGNPLLVLHPVPSAGVQRSVSVYKKDYVRAKRIADEHDRVRFVVYYNAARTFLNSIERELGITDDSEE